MKGQVLTPVSGVLVLSGHVVLRVTGKEWSMIKKTIGYWVARFGFKLEIWLVLSKFGRTGLLVKTQEKDGLVHEFYF